VIISEKVGYSKPEKEIFTFAAQQVCVALSDCIYVGDSFETDYTGSINAGMKGIWLDRKNSKLNLKCEKIKSLVELLRHSFILQK
jgi:putative hydrolase of the HAD superfamily